MRKLDTVKDVEAQLKLMRDDSGTNSPTGTAYDPQFINLVWEKVGTIHMLPQLNFSLRPTLAVTCVALLAYVVFIQFQKLNLPTEKPAAASADISINGFILEGKGNYQNISPLLSGERKKAGETITEGDRLQTNSDSWLTFYLPGAGYFHLAEGSLLVVERARQASINSSPLACGRSVSCAAALLRCVGEDKGGGYNPPHPNLPPRRGEGMTRVHYQLILEQGELYSKVNHLESGSLLRLKTPFGTARIVGTDFLVDTNKDEGMGVSVLNGTVEIIPLGASVDRQSVQEGFRGLISLDSGGRILINELEREAKMKLEQRFNHIFDESIDSQVKVKEGQDERRFRIVARRTG